MTSSTSVACIGRRLALSAALLLAFAAVDSLASVTVTKTNNSGATVDGSSVNQAVNFTAADFGAGALVGKVTVTISFAKLSEDSRMRPGFNEVGFTLSSATSSAVLVQSDSTFQKGPKGSSFDGTITFDMDAADLVNVDPDQIQSGTYQPHTGDLDGFVGEDAIGNWTLNISDSKDKGKGNTPLTVTSWSIAVTTIPEPDSIGLWGMTGLLGALIVFHRPRRREGHRASIV